MAETFQDETLTTLKERVDSEGSFNNEEYHNKQKITYWEVFRKRNFSV